MDISNMHHEKREVGRTMKKSKIYYVWEFVLDGKLNKIELFQSLLSGKKKLVVNGKLDFESDEYTTEFYHFFRIKNHQVTLEQKGIEKFELVIDKRPFTLLMNDEVTKTYAYVKKDESIKLIDELTEGLYKPKVEQNVSSRNEIPNFFDDNDFDFGADKIEEKQPDLKEKNNNVDFFNFENDKKKTEDILETNNHFENNKNNNNNNNKFNHENLIDDLFGGNNKNSGSDSNKNSEFLNPFGETIDFSKMNKSKFI